MYKIMKKSIDYPIDKKNIDIKADKLSWTNYAKAILKPYVD